MIRALLLSPLFILSFSSVTSSTDDERHCKANDIQDGTCVANIEQSNNINDTKSSNLDLEDNHEMCKMWASRDECEKNTSYMSENCKKSCKEHFEQKAKGLADIDDNCSDYAMLGECDANSKYMRSYCAKSCFDFDRHIADTPMMKSKKPRYTRLNTKSDRCQLYMAESSIPNSGLGMYTTVPFKKNDLVFHPEIVVSYFDSVLHYERNYYGTRLSPDEWKEIVGTKTDLNNDCQNWAKDDECDANPRYMLNDCAKSCALFKSGKMQDFDHDEFWLPDSYYWNAGNTDSLYEAEKTDSLVPGIGALANSHTGLVNVEMTRPSIDSAGMHNSVDPGVGAFSTHHNLGWIAKTDIPAGMEIFAGYGDSWFEGREDKFGPLPLSYDFNKADKIMGKFWKIAKETDPYAQDFLTLVKSLPKRPNIRMAIPSKLEEAKKVSDVGTARITVPNVIRSELWLQENGICLDNIREEKSDVLQAGRGAFATRLIQQDQVIAPLPLIHVTKERLKMYDEKEDGSFEYATDQLLLNYCYGHTNSSLCFFPYSPVTNFVNHHFNPERRNAKIQWSTSKYHKSHWMNKTVDEVMSEPYAGLMLEFVATRDIQEGEEIFINYGPEWEAAWQNHLENWNPPNEEYATPLYHLNHVSKIRTVEEQKVNPYPKQVMTVCFVHSKAVDQDFPVSWNRFRIGSVQHGVDENSISIDDSSECIVMKRDTTDSGKDLYEAVVRADDYDESGNEVLVKDIPRHAIELVYRNYQSDQHLKTAFRHPIMLPDKIFPNKWMNL